MKNIWLILSLVTVASVYAKSPTSVLLISGEPSHGPGEHEFPAGCAVLAKALNESGLNLEATVHSGSWPEPELLIEINAIVVYCDGNEDHLLLSRVSELEALAERGVGMVFLHYALDGIPGRFDETLLDTVGAYYHDQESSNPLWTLKEAKITAHPVTRGVNPFELKDEYYYNLTFGDITPLLQAIPPEEGQAHTLAWTYGNNAFGFTGGHYHSSWLQPDFRKLVLNGIIWAAGLDVPEGGVESIDPIIAKNKSIRHAIAKGEPADVKNHILLGADVNEKNKQGWTPLHFATVRGQTECAEVLIEAGASLDERTGTLKTPLHFSADRGFLEITRLLVVNGADLSIKDDEGWTPLHYAAEKDRIDIAAYLIAQGAVVDEPSKRGGTPLHEASASASAEMITLLLENGADKTIQAANGRTPLDYALELGNQPAQRLLE
jgi:ankyrin repeat protein